MKVKRYVTEYATDKTKKILKNDLMDPALKRALISKIEKVLLLYKKGLITSEEVIRGILELEG